jgi:hypothetical protein
MQPAVLVFGIVVCIIYVSSMISLYYITSMQRFCSTEKKQKVLLAHFQSNIHVSQCVCAAV